MIVLSIEFSNKFVFVGIFGEIFDVIGKWGKNLDDGYYVEEVKYEVEKLRYENFVRKLEKKFVFVSFLNLVCVEEWFFELIRLFFFGFR